MNIQIRPWQPEHVDMMMEWVGKDRSILKALNVPEETSDFDVRRMLVTALVDGRFVAMRGDTPVAAIAVYDAKPNGVGFVSIVANPETSGFATVAACRQMIAALFNGIGMRDLRVQIADDNDTALKLARHCGFVDTGVRQLKLEKEDYDNGPGNSSSDR